MTDYTELKRAAEAAAQGHWNQDGFEVQNDDINDYRVARCNRLTDAKFIAAASPAAVLALIAERDQLKAENEALRKRIDDMSPFKGAPLTGPDLKCLACGGYHYGLQGLPCPNMRVTASAAIGNGEQS